MSAAPRDGWPEGVAAPARRALAAAGFDRVEDLARAREEEVAALHGMGPTSIAALKRALAERGLTFADG